MGFFYFNDFMKIFITVFLSFLLISCGNDKKSDKKNIERSNTNIQKADQNSNISQAYREALQNINLAIRNDINNKDLYLQRAQLLSEIKDYDAAISDVNRAIAIDSANVDAYLLLSDIYSESGNLAKVRDVLEKALQKDPNHAPTHIKIAELFLYAKNHEQSLKHADLAIKSDMYNANAYFIKGFNFMEMGDTTKAISSFQTAVEQKPDFIDAYLQLGLLYSMQDNPLALEYLNNIFEIEPNHREALYTYAMYAQTHEMFNEAIQAYTKLANAYPSFKEAHYNLGYVHMYYLTLYREATIYFTDAIRAEPNYYQAYYNRGYSFELMGDIANAAKDYKKALSIKPDYTLAAKGLERVEQTNF